MAPCSTTVGAGGFATAGLFLHQFTDVGLAIADHPRRTAFDGGDHAPLDHQHRQRLSLGLRFEQHALMHSTGAFDGRAEFGGGAHVERGALARLAPGGAHDERAMTAQESLRRRIVGRAVRRQRELLRHAQAGRSEQAIVTTWWSALRCSAMALVSSDNALRQITCRPAWPRR